MLEKRPEYPEPDIEFKGLNRNRSGSEAKPPKVDDSLADVQNASKLADLDPGVELLAQYKIARRLLSEISDDESVPVNQKAQLINSLNALIGSILKQQTELHNMERLKTLEQALIETLKLFPDIKIAFLKAYKDALEAV